MALFVSIYLWCVANSFAMLIGIILGAILTVGLIVLISVLVDKRRSKKYYYQLKAQDAVMVRNFDLAKKYLKEGLEKYPNEPTLHYGLGVVYYNLKMPNTALKYLKRAAVLENENWDVWFLIGRIYYERHHYENAIKYFSKTVEVNPAITRARFGLGNIFFERGQIDKSIAQYEAIIKNDPLNANARHNLGSCHLEKEEYEKAIDHYEMATLLEDSPYSWYWIGYCYLQLGNKKEAVKAFEESFELGFSGAKEAIEECNRQDSLFTVEPKVKPKLFLVRNTAES